MFGVRIILNLLSSHPGADPGGGGGGGVTTVTSHHPSLSEQINRAPRLFLRQRH